MMAIGGAKNMPAGHTAGIFADMRLDGPEIGTLVAVIDRAKNLPNRRTMGKQDPYCAMRLGKEAKKTGTDRRGGQTPKWDQELRFTVHDSPDYYKLKCSVFNDDKKTDLIGEAWIDLTSVVVPGGGQNDMWHQLQSKGKYAGDVRMELTYYDTRSKSDPTSEKPRDNKSDRSGLHSHGSDAAGGSRRLGPRDVRRRPLPPDQNPVVGERPALREPAHSAPLPQVRTNESEPYPHQTFGEQWTQDSGRNPFTGVQSSHHLDQSSLNHPSHSYPLQHEYEPPQSEPYWDSPYQATSNHDGYGFPGEDPDSSDFNYPAARSSFPVTPTQLPHQSFLESDRRNYSEPFDRSRTRSSPSSAPSVYGSSPPSFNGEPYASGSNVQQHSPSFPRYSTSPIKNDVFRDSPLRQSISQRDVNLEPVLRSEAAEDEGPPPPPPAHRSNLPASTPPISVQPNIDHVQMPQPLNLSGSNRRLSALDRSPLQNIERNYDPELQSPAIANRSSAEKQPLYLPYSKPTYSTVDWRGSGSPYEISPNGIENMPPSLRSGAGRSTGETVESNMRNEDHLHRQPLDLVHSSERRDMSRSQNGAAHYWPPQVEDDWPRTPGAPAAKIPAQRMNSDPRSISRRKAVSPQLMQADQDQALTNIPFGPDSYDVFNPSSPATSPATGSEQRYENPEQAKEVARQHEVQKLRDQGPIIGNDGRVIDPSDHLPTDTWAPEPTRKNRKPEVVVRYKTKENPSPAPSGRTSTAGPARPHSIAGPIYSSPGRAEELPAMSAQQQNARARLQKRASGRPLPFQPYSHTHSSPAIPTNHHPAGGYHTPSPRSSHSTQPISPEYPSSDQRKHRASVGNSPLYGYGRAPPVPDKVPISPGGWHGRCAGGGSTDALSAELSTIDIGAGVGVRGGQAGRGQWP